MAYITGKKNIWNTSTPNSGTLFDEEFSRIYNNTDYLKAEIESNDVDIAANASDINTIQIALNALPPVGSVIPWIPGYFSDGSNGGLTTVSITLPANWEECNGQEVYDTESPLFNGSGRYVPNLTDDRFLMGSTIPGSTGGNNSSTHNHDTNSKLETISLAHEHTTDTQLGTISLGHKHTVDPHSHDQGSLFAKVRTGAAGSILSVMASVNKNTYPYAWTSGTGNTSGNTAGGAGTEVSGTTGPSTPETGTSTELGDYNINHGHTADSSLSNYDATHNHTTNTQSNTENRPLFLTCTYLIRIK